MFFSVKIYTEKNVKLYLTIGTILVVIVWSLDLQLPMLSVPITTNVSSNPAHGEVYSIQQKITLRYTVCQ